MVFKIDSSESFVLGLQTFECLEQFGTGWKNGLKFMSTQSFFSSLCGRSKQEDSHGATKHGKNTYKFAI